MRVVLLLRPLMDAEFHGVSSQTWRTSTAKNGVSPLSEEASACKTAFSMSSGLYSELAIQEPVWRNWKKFMIAPKTAFSRKTEQ